MFFEHLPLLLDKAQGHSNKDVVWTKDLFFCTWGSLSSVTSLLFDFLLDFHSRLFLHLRHWRLGRKSLKLVMILLLMILATAPSSPVVPPLVVLHRVGAVLRLPRHVVFSTPDCHLGGHETKLALIPRPKTLLEGTPLL